MSKEYGYRPMSIKTNEGRIRDIKGFGYTNSFG